MKKDRIDSVGLAGIVGIEAHYMRLLADSPLWHSGKVNLTEPSWCMGAHERLLEYVEFLTMAEDVHKALVTLAPSVKTRDVGKCQKCGQLRTQSGMDPFCQKCALIVLGYLRKFIERINDELGADETRPTPNTRWPSSAERSDD